MKTFCFFSQWLKKDEENSIFRHAWLLGSWNKCPAAVLLECGCPSCTHCLCCSHTALLSPGSGLSQGHSNPALCRKSLLVLALGSPWPWDEPLNSAALTPVLFEVVETLCVLQHLAYFAEKRVKVFHWIPKRTYGTSIKRSTHRLYLGHFQTDQSLAPKGTSIGQEVTLLIVS